MELSRAHALHDFERGIFCTPNQEAGCNFERGFVNVAIQGPTKESVKVFTS